MNFECMRWTQTCNNIFFLTVSKGLCCPLQARGAANGVFDSQHSKGAEERICRWEQMRAKRVGSQIVRFSVGI